MGRHVNIPIFIPHLGCPNKCVFCNQKIISGVVEFAPDDVDKIKDLTHLFNVQNAKKNALRIVKLNGLLDKVSDQAIERFEKRPGEFSNKDLLDYMTVVQNSIDRSTKALNLEEQPLIQINQNTSEVNVNLGENSMNRESREKVLNAVNMLLKIAQSNNINNNVIDAEINEKEGE